MYRNYLLRGAVFISRLQSFILAFLVLLITCLRAPFAERWLMLHKSCVETANKIVDSALSPSGS